MQHHHILALVMSRLAESVCLSSSSVCLPLDRGQVQFPLCPQVILAWCTLRMSVCLFVCVLACFLDFRGFLRILLDISTLKTRIRSLLEDLDLKKKKKLISLALIFLEQQKACSLMLEDQIFLALWSIGNSWDYSCHQMRG